MLPYIYDSNDPGTKTDILRGDTAPPGVETPTLLADLWLAGGHGAVAPGDDKFPSPDNRLFHTCTIPNTRGWKQSPPGSLLARNVWKPHPHRLIADLAGAPKTSARRELPPGTTLRARRIRG